MTETKMELTDWLDDLCVRFIINLPKEDLSSVARICFQVEEAQWYYEDFIRPLDPTLPSMSLRTFCMRIFQHCPLLSNFSATDHMGAFEEFLLYKTRVPVRGAILLNEAMDSVLLVKGWKKGANWSFPRGKINKDEDDLDCAIREVYEETGYDIRAAGLVPENEQVKYVEMEMREQHMRLYVFRNVPMDTVFEPRTRKEISKIMWWKLSDLPAFRRKNKGHHPEPQVATNTNKFYMVAPFLRPLKTWVMDQKKKDAQRTASGSYLTPSNLAVDDTFTEEEPTSHGTAGAFFAEDPPQFQHPVDNGASADADTMAKTTEALKRLLKIQPATQGIQSQMSSPMEKSKSNKGADLLALLRGKAEPQEAPKTNVLPHTPLDLTFDTATMPKTPQHQPPPHRDLSSMAPPPSFSIPHTSTRYHSVPSKMQSQNSPMTNNSHDQYLVHPQTHMNETRNHLQQLRHPQPLPPQVQKTLFTDSMAHSPAVAQFRNQQSAPQSHTDRFPLGIAHPQFPNIHGPMVTESKPVPPKLSEHSLNLLNVFKTREKESGPAARPPPSRDLPLRTYSQDTIKPSDVRAPLAVPGNNRGALSPPSGHSFAAPTILSARAPPSEAHKSSLLNIFKQPSGMSASTTPTANAFTQPSGMPATNVPSTNVLSNSVSGNVPVSHAHPVEPLPNPLNQQYKNRPVENFGNIMPPTSGLPRSSHPATREPNFGQAQVTTSSPRQKLYPATKGTNFGQDQAMRSSPRQRSHRQNGSSGNSNAQPKVTQQTAQKGFQPQILKRPQNSPVSQHTGLPVPVQFSQSRGSSGTEARSAATSSISETRRPSHSAEQKQALLALLSKKTSNNPPPLFTNPSVAGAQFGQTQADLARSRIGSLGNDTSRRGSQTPMSPADQGFLLDYLAGEVAKTKGR